MFLDMIMKRNPELVDFSVSLHQKGHILPDTYVLDLDKIMGNAHKLSMKADELNIHLYFMLKQIGRNPFIAKKIMHSGISKSVVVDFKEAKIMMDHNIPIGNIGHLVQIPDHFLKKVIKYGVDYITVYSVDKLKKIDKIADELGIEQGIMLRVLDKGDSVYPGQYGGFSLHDLEEEIKVFKTLKHCKITGITSFPCILYNKTLNEFERTHNTQTIQSAKDLLEQHGFFIKEVNVPSANTIRSLPLIKEIGGTQGEPGHALTGTSPMHSIIELEEKPSYVYVSEVSHNGPMDSFIYGGGYYPRGHLENVMFDTGTSRTTSKIKFFPSDNIDYYLEAEDQQPIGSTAIMAFRTQMFVTRSHIAVVKGLNCDKPELVGIFDSQGKRIEGV